LYAICAILINFMRLFSKFWKLAVRDNDTKKSTNGVGKAHWTLAFVSGAIERV